MMQAVTKLTEFELATKEGISYFTRVEINAELIVSEREALIAEIDEKAIKDAIEDVVGKSIELKAERRNEGSERMTPSIYDLKDAEIEAAKRIRRERVRAIVGGIVAAPFALAALVAWVVVCACL